MSEALHGHDSVDAAETPSMGPRTASHGQVATGGRVGVVEALTEAYTPTMHLSLPIEGANLCGQGYWWGTRNEDLVTCPLCLSIIKGRPTT